MNTAIAACADLACMPLPDFDVEDWDAVSNVFAGLPSTHFGQAWKPVLQPRFLPARTHIGFDAQFFWMFSEFEDADIFNTSVALNQHVYKLGDVFEIFLRPLPGDEYIEFHVTPDNRHLQLWWPRARRSFKDEGWIPRFLSQACFRSWTQVLPDEKRWRILAAIPFETLGLDTPRAGDEWLYSFGRYDYTRGFKRPILSSTSPHRVPDFHRQHEWNRLVFSDV